VNIPLDEVLHFDAITSDATGAVTDADSTPTWSIFEEATDTPILENQNFTKRTSLTGNYRGSATLSTANGFEVGKWYSVIGTAIVSTITGKAVVHKFRVVAAESAAGVPKVDVSHFGGTAGIFSTGIPDVNVARWASANATLDDTMTLPAVHTETIDAVAEANVVDAIWNEDATGHQDQGSFGQAIGDPGSDSDTIWALANTNLNATVGSRATQASVDALFTTAMVESYATDGAAPTPAQSLFLIQQALTEFVISGTTITIKRLNGSTTAAVVTLDSATIPTSATRTT
jgi:hypothetical protein